MLPHKWKGVFVPLSPRHCTHPAEAGEGAATSGPTAPPLTRADAGRGLASRVGALSDVSPPTRYPGAHMRAWVTIAEKGSGH